LLGQLELARGDVVAAREHMESAVRQVDTLPSTAATAAVHLLRAAAMLADGQSADAAAVAEAALSGVADGWLGQGLRMLLVAVGGGHVPLVGDMPAVPAYTGAALVSIGERARAEGDAGSGADRARDALRVLVDAGIALYVPDALDLLARCTPEGDGAGRLRRASAALRRQMGTVPQRWLAPGVADEAAAAPAEDLPEVSLADVLALATRGRGTRRRPPVGWESLTPAELAVVRLVADGDTNAQIAQRLFVSRRTVATHLEHVFTKLDVRTRAEVAAIAARQLP
jgi:DNA-binding CsgD family transcriptional regulator